MWEKLKQIEQVIRNHVRNVARGVCPFAASSADKVHIVIVETLTVETVSNELQKEDWDNKDTILIVAAEDSTPEIVDSVAKEIDQLFPFVEAFGAHPEHAKETRRDPIPNVQINSRVALELAREQLARKR